MKKKLFYCLIAMVTVASCRKPNENNIESVAPSERVSTLKLGKKLENPYSVANMRKAYQRLKSKGASISNDPVITTHYYVRFLPTDSTQYDLLKNDTTLVLYPYPLDYEMDETDDSFDTETNEPTPMYAAVPKEHTFDPGVSHEVIEELYIPEEEYGDEWDESQYSSISKTGAKSKLAFLRGMVNESMKLTKNFEDTIIAQKGAKTKFEPSGTISVRDTRLGRLIPLVGVQVRARHWFRTKQSYTDENGYYQMPNFRNSVRYSVVYETNRFDVRSGTFGQAYYVGPKQNYAWNKDIDGGVQAFYCHIFRGARRYFYGNIAGLARPRMHNKLKYGAYNKAGDHLNWGAMSNTQGGIFEDIEIYRFDDNDNSLLESDEVFSATIHETAHSTHVDAMNGIGRNLRLLQFAQVSPMLRESWPVAVEWQITQMEYRERGIPTYSGPDYNVNADFPIAFGYQFWNPGRDDPKYTPIFIDIIDNNNQGGDPYHNGRIGLCDNVSGYTLAQIEADLLKHIYGISSLSDELKAHKPAGITDAHIDELLSFTSSGCSAPPPPSTNGLIAHWPFNGNGTDASGNGNNATLYSLTSTTDRNGNSNSALYFNGYSSYAYVADNVALRLNNTDFTVSAWVNLNTYNSSYGSVILSKHIAGANNGWGWSINGYASSPTGPLFFGPGGGSTNAVSNAIVNLNNWHQLTSVYNTSTHQLSMYIDGILSNTVSGILTPNGAISAYLNIGKDSAGSNYYFNGTLDEIRIYNRALNISEINQL